MGAYPLDSSISLSCGKPLVHQNSRTQPVQTFYFNIVHTDIEAQNCWNAPAINSQTNILSNDYFS